MTRAIGLGCMRLSTDPNRDEARAIEVITAGLRAGVTLLDTSDAYVLDDTDANHNEKLIARALTAWGGDRRAITVVSKGGLTRPQGRWVPDGRASQLRSAAERSAAALGGPIDLYLLHAPDPKTSLSTSVRALAEIQRSGVARAVGLSNVNAVQLEEACALAPIAAVEVKLSAFDLGAIHGGVLAACIEKNIRLIAHSPLGGAKGVRKFKADPVIKEVAARRGVAPADVGLAWLYALHDGVTAIPGATKVETAARAAAFALDEEDRAKLERRFDVLLPYRNIPATAASAREVIILMGIQAAGKSTLVQNYLDRGYQRLNRDLCGGTLRGLLPVLEKLLEPEDARVVLDNTYASRASRGAVIATARKKDASVRCVHLDTSFEDAQINAVSRMIERHGRLLDPPELKQLAKKDPNLFGPDVQFRFKRELEPPVLAEGFSAVETQPFVRRPRPEHDRRGVLFELDGVVRRSRSGQRAPMSPDDVELYPGARDRLARAAAEGFSLFGMSWRPEVSAGALSLEEARAVDARTAELLALPLEFFFCPHGAGPAICWCRKPLPGLGVLWVEQYRIDVGSSLHVGHGPADRTFAERLGLSYEDAGQYFARVPK